MNLRRLIRRAVTDWRLWMAKRRVHRACPEIASIPPIARDRSGRWQSTSKARQDALHDRLRKEIAA